MKTLDRYIIRHFLLNFAILFAVLMLLFVVVDLIVDLDEFLEAGAYWAQRRNVAAIVGPLGLDATAINEALSSHVGTDELMRRFGIDAELAQRLRSETAPSTVHSALGTVVKIGDYYGPLLVMIYVFFSGLLVVTAMGFTVSAMLRTRELVAMVASGISMYRVAAPVLLVGIGLNALALPAQELVIPAFAAKLARRKSQIEHDAIENLPILFAAGEEGVLLSAAELDASQNRLVGVRVLERGDDRLITRMITAREATWDERRNGWVLLDGYAGRPTPESMRYAHTDPEEVDFYATRLSPTVLLARNAAIYSRLLPMSELQSMQNNEAVTPRQRAQITQVIWSRFSLFVMNVLILVMGLPFFLQLAGGGNLLIQSLKAAAVVLGAWGGGLVLLQTSAAWMNPVAAAWLPVVLLLPASAILLQYVRT